MIYFITNEPQHLIYYRTKLYDNVEVLEDSNDTFLSFKLWIKNKYLLKILL